MIGCFPDSFSQPSAVTLAAFFSMHATIIITGSAPHDNLRPATPQPTPHVPALEVITTVNYEARKTGENQERRKASVQEWDNERESAFKTLRTPQS